MSETTPQTPARPQNGVSTPVTQPEQEKNLQNTKKVFVKAGDQPAFLLDLDSKGSELYFDARESWVELSDSEYKSLSTGNRSRYSQAREQHLLWVSSKNDGVLEKMLVNGQFSGSAGEKINGVTSLEGMEHRWARPDRVSYALGKGWRLATPDEVRTFVKPEAGHVQIGELGVTELVLMVRPKEVGAASRKAKDEASFKKLGAVVKSGEESMKDFRRKDSDFQDI